MSGSKANLDDMVNQARAASKQQDAKVEEFLRRPVNTRDSNRDALFQESGQDQTERNKQDQDFRNRYPRPSIA